jgi:hypothetical protein
MNNQYIQVENGKAQSTDHHLADARVMTINELAAFIFAEESPEMNLMLN